VFDDVKMADLSMWINMIIFCLFEVSFRGWFYCTFKCMNMSPAITSNHVFFIIISSPHTCVLKHMYVCILLDVLSAALESDTL